MTALAYLDDEEGWDLASTLDALERHLRRFIHFSTEHHSVAAALYCAGTYVFEHAETFPMLGFMSPVRRSGKTRALDVIAPIVARPWRVIRPSEAVLFRKIDRDKPTLMLDEVDTIWAERREHEGLRALLNAGNRRGTTVPRAVAQGKGFELTDFEIYGPKILAGIGSLPDTVRDRTIVIPMVRKRPRDHVERLRTRDAETLGEPFRCALARILRATTDLVVPGDALPDELDDRAQDSWEPLLALADLAGEDWRTTARAAAISLSIDADSVDDETIDILLLRDMKTALGADHRLATTAVIERLLSMELSPWNELYGKPLTPHKLAKVLRRFKIKPFRDRVGSYYAATQFRDAWDRYLP